MPNEHAQLLAHETHGPVIQLLRNLQGTNGLEWLRALNKFLRKEDPWGPYEPPQITLWKELDLSKYPTSTKLLRALKRTPYYLYPEVVSRWEREFEITPPVPHVRLTKLLVADLGFPVGASFDEVMERAASFGLQPFPEHLAPLVATLLAVDYGKDQPHGEIMELPCGLNPLGQAKVWLFSRYLGADFKLAGHARADFILPNEAFVFLMQE